MDHELKQRLIGAVVVTALAAIFIPMLFDDPVDNTGKAVTELTIPAVPTDTASETASKLPADKAEVLNRPDTELSVSEEEENHANAIGESPVTNMPDGEQTEPPGMAESLAGEPGSDVQGAEPDEGQPVKPGQNEEPTLDTGVVEEAQPHVAPKLKPVESVKVPEHKAEVPPKKPAVSEKPKPKPAVAAEKSKLTAKPQKEADSKESSKLVRWSIQAGSFSKKENAQALVDKLRKQGLPASFVTKGDLYRVKIGPELDKKKAADMKAKLDKQNIQSYLHSE
jgi:DedD protein